MKIELKPNLPFLTVQQVGDLTSALDATHTRTIKAIERLQKDIDAQKASIASRWKNANIGTMDKRRIEAEEIKAVILGIRQNSQKELDALFREAGASYSKIIEQRGFYDSPVKTISRAGLGDPRRTDYLRQLQHAGLAEIAHIAQVAVSTNNVVLAAALVTMIDGMSTASRPFTARHLAEAFGHDDFVKAREYLKIAEHRFQGTVIAVRTWMAERSNPLDTVSMALMGRTLDEAVIASLEVSDES